MSRLLGGAPNFLGEFWEGSCTVTGTLGGAPVKGVAFAELIKRYDDPSFDLNLVRREPGLAVLDWRVRNWDPQAPLRYQVFVERPDGSVVLNVPSLELPVLVLDDPSLPTGPRSSSASWRTPTTGRCRARPRHPRADASSRVTTGTRRQHRAMAQKKVLILGGGLSALSAGDSPLARGRRRKLRRDACLHGAPARRQGVELAAPRRPLMEIGFHAIFGYYHEIRAMLARAGHPIDDPRWFTSNDG